MIVDDDEDSRTIETGDAALPANESERDTLGDPPRRPGVYPPGIDDEGRRDCVLADSDV
jgi:hypothetical protein